MPILSLNQVVNVSINVAPVTAIIANFNIGLIVGDSTIISEVIRVKKYAGLLEMIADGWLGTEPEYKAALLYFSAKPAPAKVIIGRKGLTDTALQAVTACRIASTEWYICTVCEATKADILAVAAFIEAVVPTSVYFYTTKDADILTNTAGNVFLTLKGLKYRKTMGQYSNTDDAVVSIMGYAMGANTGLVGSAYTLAYKPENGVAVEVALTDAQCGTIEDSNGNIYISRGVQYSIFESGVMADGTPADEVINLDILANSIQQSVMNLLVTIAKVPQTEDGISMILNAIVTPCKAARDIGFVAPGVWKAAPLFNLDTGDTLSTGYAIMASSIREQSVEDRAARKAPPIYVALKLAGAVEHVVINVQVNR
jgi:hypothetical protein